VFNIYVDINYIARSLLLEWWTYYSNMCHCTCWSWRAKSLFWNLGKLLEIFKENSWIKVSVNIIGTSWCHITRKNIPQLSLH